MGHVLVWHLDGRLPNLALMRLAAHHRALGDTVELRRGTPVRLLWDQPTRVYGSLLFTRSRPLGEQLRALYPDALLGGTGWDVTVTLAQAGIPETGPLDYSLYPGVSPQHRLYATGLPPALPLLCGAQERGARPARRHDCHDLARGALAAAHPPAGQ